MEKLLKMNRVALLASAFILQLTASNDDERKSAAKEVAMRSRFLTEIDARRATSMACSWIDREGMNF